MALIPATLPPPNQTTDPDALNTDAPRVTEARGNRSRRTPPTGGEPEPDETTEIGADDPIEALADDTIAQSAVLLNGGGGTTTLRGGTGGSDRDADLLSDDLTQNGALDIEVIAVERGADEVVATQSGEVLRVHTDSSSELIETKDGSTLLLLDETLTPEQAEDAAVQAVVHVVTERADALGVDLDPAALRRQLYQDLYEDLSVKSSDLLDLGNGYRAEWDISRER